MLQRQRYNTRANWSPFDYTARSEKTAGDSQHQLCFSNCRDDSRLDFCFHPINSSEHSCAAISEHESDFISPSTRWARPLELFDRASSIRLRSDVPVFQGTRMRSLQSGGMRFRQLHAEVFGWSDSQYVFDAFAPVFLAVWLRSDDPGQILTAGLNSDP